jgi:ABC-2 type transport system permease protein
MRLASLRNKALNLKTDSFTKALVVFFGLGNVIGLGFWVSYEAFRFVEQFPAFGAALNAKMISLLFFTLLLLVILSTIIVAYTTIFLGRETDFLFQNPAPPRTVLAVKLAEAIAFSSWATLFLCFPVLVSFGWKRKAPASYYFEAAGILALFLLFAGLTGAALAMAIAPIVRRLSGRQLLCAGGAVLALLGWAFLRSFNFWDMDGENDLLLLDRFMSQLSTMHSPYFPGQWASAAILAAAAGNHAEVLFQGGTLLANTIIFLPILSWYGRRHYGGEWIATRSGRVETAKRIEDEGTEAGEPVARPAVRSRMRSRNPLEALIHKDVLIFLRDPAQLSQSLLFVLLMVIYSLSLIRIPVFTGRMQLVVYFANLGAVCMIISSFTSRFIFPLVSLEGRAFWIVGLAPVSRAYLLWQKAVFGLGISVTLGLATIAASNASLKSPADLFLAAVYSMMLAGVCLTSLATGLGAAYPAFDEDNPARIAVGLGGTLNFFASALSVAIIIALEALPYLCFGQEPAGVWIYASHALALLFTACLSMFCFRLGSLSLLRRDF